MVEFITCFKCWGGKAVLTYEENRVYKVSCECGCEYIFEHCSMKAAQEYHNKMLELHGEIDRNAKMKAENQRLKVNSMIQEHIIQNGGNPLDKDKIVKLIMENTALKAENERLRVKCDSAVFDMKLMGNKCSVCKKYKISCKPRADELDGCASFEWRGIEETP